MAGGWLLPVLGKEPPMPRSNPKRAKGGRVVRCWGLFSQGDDIPYRCYSNREMAREQIRWEREVENWPGWTVIRRIEIRELPRRSKAKP